KTAHKLAIPVIQHAEDTRMTHGGVMHAGPTSFRLGLRGINAHSEACIVGRDINLAAEIGAHVHIAHLSTKEAVEYVRTAKEKGVHVTCEVTPHHLLLTDEEVADYDTNCKMNPPLRSEADREAMWEGLHDGTIDCIATDHAPHAAHEKEQEFERAPNGITGLETSLGLSLSVLHCRHGMPLAQVLALLSARPAAVLGLAAGTLAVGSQADVLLLSSETEQPFYVNESRSLARNTPFDGWSLPGRVYLTMHAGRIVYENVPLVQQR